MDKLEIRRFAIANAVMFMGVGAPAKDIITKAREIEEYIIGGADVPEYEVNDVAKKRKSES